MFKGARVDDVTHMKARIIYHAGEDRLGLKYVSERLFPHARQEATVASPAPLATLLFLSIAACWLPASVLGWFGVLASIRCAIFTGVALLMSIVGCWFPLASNEVCGGSS